VGCSVDNTAPGTAAAEKAAGDAHQVLSVIEKSDSTNLSNARKEADTSLGLANTAASASGQDICVKAKDARFHADKAMAHLAAYRLEVEKQRLPTTAQTMLGEVLEAYERTLAGLAKASLTATSAAASGKDGGGASTALSSILK
jgi:hypothetical protein